MALVQSPNFPRGRHARWFVVIMNVLFVPPHLVACEPVKLPHQQPGPSGCGSRDPRGTAPGMLSVAQKEAFRKQGSPSEVRPNDRGGLDWLYHRSTGSVFGEEQTVEILSFDGDGLLYRQETELLRKVGK